MIRTLEERDAERYRAVRLRALREEPDAFGSSYEEQVDSPLAWFVERIRETETRFTLGAFDGETLMGSIMFTRETGMKMRHRGVITGMYVAPEGRGRGIGRALLLGAIERARALPGVEQIHLAVVTRNSAARALYIGRLCRLWNGAACAQSWRRLSRRGADDVAVMLMQARRLSGCTCARQA